MEVTDASVAEEAVSVVEAPVAKPKKVAAKKVAAKKAPVKRKKPTTKANDPGKLLEQ